MAQRGQSRRASSTQIAVDAIPMKGISPVWYAVGGGCVLVGVVLAVMLSVGGKSDDKLEQPAPANAVVPAVDSREQAAERRRHLEITQRSLERLKVEEEQNQPSDQGKESGRPAATAAAAAAPAAPAAPAPAAPAPAQPPPKKALDSLDSIGSDITKELGK
jgi:hypothetical protein